jgi:uncharacterized protein (TIGR00730 family)
MPEKNLRRICVFCASSFGVDPSYLSMATELGSAIAHAGYGLVYGGANVGLMGAVADAALAGGAEVIGVLPETLSDREIAHPGLTELYQVGTMHERKALMASHADAFIALPGGYGTLDEFLEILTWAQLRIHAKPCILINACGYYDGLLTFLAHAVTEGFLKEKNRNLLRVALKVDEALDLAQRHFSNGTAAPELMNLP